MPINIVMPNAGFDAQEVRLLEWLKNVGDTVQKGEAIALIESDKANVELESIANGVLLAQLCLPNQEVPVGSVIALVGTPDEWVAQSANTNQSPADTRSVSPIAMRVASDHQVNINEVVGSGARGRVTRRDVEAYMSEVTNGKGVAEPLRALPKVRRYAREHQIDLEKISHQLNGSVVTMADLIAHQAQTNPLPQPVATESPTSLMPIPEGAREIPLSRIRHTIARRLSDSMREAPHFYVSGEFDLEAVANRLRQLPAPAPKWNDLIQYITVQTLLRVPQLNATFQQDRLFHHSSVNLAVAVSREDGLFTPVLRDAQNYSLQGLANLSRSMVQRTRENRLQADDLQGGTFTISNLGIVQQVDHFTAVINPPQVAILAVGTVKQRPMVVDGGLFVRHSVHLTLSGDHRVVDGMDLARFMATFQEELSRFAHS